MNSGGPEPDFCPIFRGSFVEAGDIVVTSVGSVDKIPPFGIEIRVPPAPPQRFYALLTASATTRNRGLHLWSLPMLTLRGLCRQA